MEMKNEPIELGSGHDRFARRGWAAVSEERGGEADMDDDHTNEVKTDEQKEIEDLYERW
uniref:Uncharacterized protein n=1 Tax=Cucumis melo TaxID=3656 RepID=A0A9I9EE59_CUCME